MTAVKFCGLNKPEDVAWATALGVSAVGFVLYEKSARAVSIDEAVQLAKCVPPFVTVVALVVNMPEQDLVYLAHHMPFDVVQFHGDESAHQCHLMADRIGKRWIKAIGIQPDDTSESILQKLHELKHFGASGALLDTYEPTQYGGTGRSFDWSKIPKNPPLPIILAGGLTAQNVADAIAQTGVYAVDVSGGIEKEKGVKCKERMQAFIRAVNDADDKLSS